jgi:hypothetical protein
MTGTDIFARTLAFDYGDQERSDIMRKVWTPTPWMIEVFTGSINSERERSIARWCWDRFGQQASPIHGIDGVWQRGCATVHGWTWYGFATEAQMLEFLAAWPAQEQAA